MKQPALALARLMAAGLFVAAPPVSAQPEGPSILSLLPVRGQLEMDGETRDRLEETDYLSDGRRMQRYAFEGTAGDPVTIDLVSDDFDAFLIVIAPDGSEATSDDDGGGACHARVSWFLEQTGSYGVIAASLSGATGAFTLRLGRRQGPRAPGDCSGFGGNVLEVVSTLEPLGTLRLEGASEVEGELDPGDAELEDGGHVEVWAVTGDPGQTVIVDLSSRSFDALLFAVAPDGSDYASDDDSGGACNSRLVLRAGEAPYIVAVSSFDPAGLGPYTLRVSDEAGPLAEGDCPGFVDPRLR